MNTNEEYPIFGGISREIMIWGVPIMPLAFVAVGSAIIAMIAMILIGGKGLLFMLTPIPIFFGMKTFTANDNQALQIVGLELLIFFKRRNARIFNGTTTIIGTKLGRDKNDYIRFFQKSTK
ncbi:type IV secretion system protein VirB3 [Oligella urethralis]|uniref:VirB3 family type IV secretion system protein n=1 Tax=Oligella urethralis TaxID=90245 RepID=UPI000CFEEA13|nr:VirB3 family type IV secretion system protein [Oligella urethralis]AVL70627.1 type IV secretion system protein VirB3 [Oligella urethralis]